MTALEGWTQQLSAQAELPVLLPETLDRLVPERPNSPNEDVVFDIQPRVMPPRSNVQYGPTVQVTVKVNNSGGAIVLRR